MNLVLSKDAINMCKFSICNHYLPIKSGCWVIIPRIERIYNHCNKQEIGNKFH